MVYMISWMRAASLPSSASSSAILSASALTAALLASIWACSSAFLASSVHFFSWPNSGPLALLSLLRAAFRLSTSFRHSRYFASFSMTSSTRGSLASWNFFLMFSLTASGLSRTNLISSMIYSPYSISVRTGEVLPSPVPFKGGCPPWIACYVWYWPSRLAKALSCSSE